MPVLVFVIVIFVLYVIAKILIPVLVAILKLFALLVAIAPFLLFIGIGILLSDSYSYYRSKRKQKWF